MTAPHFHSFGKQNQQGILWDKSPSTNAIDSKKIDVFTKAWARRNKIAPVGTHPSVSTAPASLSSSFFWQERDNFSHPANLGFTPMISTTALLSLDEKDYENKRNLLVTNIPMAKCHVIDGFIRCFSSVKETLAKSTFGGTDMVIVFYDIQQAQDCYLCLPQLLQQYPELCHVGLTYLNNSKVASTFDIPLATLQDTHLFVSLHGPFSHLVTVDYMQFLESNEKIYWFKKIEHTESHISLVVEYSDTRIAAATQKLVHGKVYKGIIFNACLFKPSGDSRQRWATNPSRNDLQPIQENDKSCTIHHHPQFAGAQDHLTTAIEYPSTTKSGHLHPSISTTTLSSTLSESTMLPPDPSASSPSYSSLTQSYLKYGSSSTEKSNSANLHQQQHQQSETDRRSFEVPPQLSAHLLGPLAQELAQINLDPVADVTPVPSTHLLGSLIQELDSTILGPIAEVVPTPSTYFYAAQNLDMEKITSGLDRRTTIMIRNIPNKYTQAMLKDWIDVSHKKKYDFLYLRIDFKNRCNVGYAFINFIDLESVISFAKERSGTTWNHFNSHKICELSYAKIQGKENLIKKFQNSTVMSREEGYRPKIFYSNGILQGEEESFPTRITPGIQMNPFIA